MKRLLVILAIVFAGFSIFGCKKADAPKDETKNVETEEVKTDDKNETEENKTDESKTEETSDIDFDEVTSVKLPMSDVSYETVDVDGKKYVDLAEFGQYMELSKNRYTYKIDKEKKTIRFKLEIVSKDKWSDPVDATGLQPEKYTLKVKNEKVEDADVILKDDKNALVDLMSMSSLLKFSYKDGEMIFDDADDLKAEVAHNRDYEWYMDQGHTGVLVPFDDKLMFIEKLSFNEPYQAVIVNSRTELSDYLMEKYDVEYNQKNTRPFIFENGSLMKNFRQNPEYDKIQNK